MLERAARLRNGLVQKSDQERHDERIHVSLPGLKALEYKARSISFAPRQPARSVLNGRYASKIRGRGLDFEELREYLPSDDVRSIDWKVTARTGAPYVRVFTEERDKPALIVVDQRMSMFFGTVHNMKAVTAAEAAALAAFRILDHGDRVGGIVFGDETIAEFAPKRNRRTAMQFLTALHAANAELSADAASPAPMRLNTVIQSVQRIAKRDHLIFILSDFDQADDRTRVLLDGLSRRNDVVLGLVFDPSAQALPFRSKVVASDSVLQTELDLSEPQVRRDVQAFSDARLARIQSWSHQMRLSVLPLTTAEDTLPQMQRLLGGVP